MNSKPIASLFLVLLSSSLSIAQSYLTEKDNPKIKVKPVVDIQAYAFNPRDIRLLEGSPFRHAMDQDAAYLLTLEPNRLLHRFYLNAGLPTRGEVYGGWESEGLSGHTLGHYLSACALMFASSGDQRFKEKTDYIVGELQRCQQARKTGYVGAIPQEDSIFWKVQHGIIHSSGFDLNGGWSPWYTVHKVLAGLLDVYLHCDNATALTVARGIGDWADVLLNGLNDEQLQRMLKCEYGGMNDALVHLYELTGDKKYLALSHKFHDQFVLGELARRIDPMPGKHSNTNVPKAIGCARRYEVSGSEEDKTIASFFWETMVGNHTYVIGGNSNYEYCGAEKKLNDRLSDNTCETCNTYNMLKLTRHLFSWQPNSTLMDFYERALYNHILASQNPQDGMMCYFLPLRMGTKKEFSNPFTTFTCCVGSGMENHSKYTEEIYAEGKDGSLWVNLFIPSELTWATRNLVVRQESKFPEDGRIALTIQSGTPQKFALKIRQPAWAGENAIIKVNGVESTAEKDASGYRVIDRTWGKKDLIEITFPMTLHTESMPDNANRVAVLYGPVVLAGQLGKEMPDPVYGTTVLLTEDRNPNSWLSASTNAPLTFATHVARPSDVHMVPLYQLFDQYYNVYWDYFTPAEWTRRQGEYEAEKKRLHDIEERTIDVIRIGEMQPERDHHLQASEKSYVSDALGRMGREVRSGGYFSFDAKVMPQVQNSLLCTYIGDDRNRMFDILVEGTKIATQELKGAATGRFFDITYDIPADLIAQKTKVEVRVQAYPNRTAGRVFGCRIIRK